MTTVTSVVLQVICVTHKDYFIDKDRIEIEHVEQPVLYQVCEISQIKESVMLKHNKHIYKGKKKAVAINPFSIRQQLRHPFLVFLNRFY